jgi:hypothetical protein
MRSFQVLDFSVPCNMPQRSAAGGKGVDGLIFGDGRYNRSYEKCSSQ